MKRGRGEKREQTEKQGENREISGKDDASGEEIRETETKRGENKKQHRERERESSNGLFTSVG